MKPARCQKCQYYTTMCICNKDENEFIARYGCICDVEPGGVLYHKDHMCETCKGDIRLRKPLKSIDVQAGGDHYKYRAIQPFHFVRRNNIPHAEGECIYKLLRWREKGGIEDLKKVIHTIQLIIEEEETHGKSA